MENVLFVVDAQPAASPYWAWLLGLPRWPVPACGEKMGPLHAQYPRYTESLQALGTSEYQGKLHETTLCGGRSCPHVPGGDTLDKRAPVLRALQVVLEQMRGGKLDLTLFAFDGVSDEPLDQGHLPEKDRFTRLVRSLREFADARMGIFVVASPATYQYLYLLSSERATPYARALAPLLQESFQDAARMRDRRVSPVALEVAPGPRRAPRARWDAAAPRVRFAPAFGADGGEGADPPTGISQLVFNEGKFVPHDALTLPPRAALNLLPWLEESKGDARRWAVEITWMRPKARPPGSVLSPFVVPLPELVTNQRQLLLGWKAGADIEQVEDLSRKRADEIEPRFGLSRVGDMGEGCSAAPTGLGSAAGVHGRVYPLVGLVREEGADTWSLRVQMAHLPSRGEELSRALAERVLGAADGDNRAPWIRDTVDRIRESFARLPQIALVSPRVELDPCFRSIAVGVDLFWTTDDRLQHHPACDASPLRGLEQELTRTLPSSYAWMGRKKRVGASTLVDLVRDLMQMPAQSGAITAGSHDRGSDASKEACVLASLRIMTEKNTNSGHDPGGPP